MHGHLTGISIFIKVTVLTDRNIIILTTVIIITVNLVLTIITVHQISIPHQLYNRQSQSSRKVGNWSGSNLTLVNLQKIMAFHEVNWDLELLPLRID